MDPSLSLGCGETPDGQSRRRDVTREICVLPSNWRCGRTRSLGSSTEASSPLVQSTLVSSLHQIQAGRLKHDNLDCLTANHHGMRWRTLFCKSLQTSNFTKPKCQVAAGV